MTPNLTNIPYEVLSNIIRYVSFEDTINLGRSCKAISVFHYSDPFCRAVLEVSCYRYHQKKCGNRLRYSQIGIVLTRLGQGILQQRNCGSSYHRFLCVSIATTCKTTRSFRRCKSLFSFNSGIWHLSPL